MKRLAIIAPNWLGDAVMALPAIADIRRALPAATIVIAARPSIAPLFSLSPSVNEVVTLDRGGAFGLGSADRLRERSPEAGILLPNSFQSALLLWRAGVTERWGYYGNGRTALLTRAMSRPAGVHQVAFYQHLVERLGFAAGPSEPLVDVPTEARRAGDALLASAGWDGRQKIVVLAPGAAYGTAKQWPPPRFAAVAAELSRQAGVCPVLVGSVADRPAGAEVAGALAADVHPLDLIGRTDLTALAGVFARAAGLVTNDSGAMHLAAAIGVPVTAIFGPTNERETRPRGRAPTTVLTHDVWCRPCMLRECPLTHACMRGVDAGAVLAAVRRAL